MAKAPQPGRSKTRLCPPLAFDDAAALSAAFIRDMTATVQRAGKIAPIDGYVAYAPIGTESTLESLIAAGTQLLLADGSSIDEPGVNGFGRPLLQTLRTLLAAGYGSACVLNSDSPTLSARLLANAAQMLAGGQAVIGPANDGGYYLLGVHSAPCGLFRDIAWSTCDVAAQTIVRADALGLPLRVLESWYDVDDAAGLRRLLCDLEQPEMAARAPATVAALARLQPQARLATMA